MEKLHRQAESDLISLQNSATNAIQGLMKQLKGAMTDEQFKNWKEFNNKWLKLKKDNRDKEAELLMDKYRKENG